MVRIGEFRRVWARCGSWGKLCQGVVRQGMAGEVWCGMVRLGLARQARRGRLRHGLVQYGVLRQAGRGLAR